MCSWNNQTAVVLWMHDPATRDAVVVREALLSPVNLQAVTEVICSRTPAQIQVFKQCYHSKFGVHLERDVEKYTQGDLQKVRTCTPDLTRDWIRPVIWVQRLQTILKLVAHFFPSSRQLLLAYVSTPRYEGLEVDRAAAEQDAKALFKAGEKKLGTDEKTFIRIFSERSRAHLAFVGAAYQNVYGNSLAKV